MGRRRHQPPPFTPPISPVIYWPAAIQHGLCLFYPIHVSSCQLRQPHFHHAKKRCQGRVHWRHHNGPPPRLSGGSTASPRPCLQLHIATGTTPLAAVHHKYKWIMIYITNITAAIHIVVQEVEQTIGFTPQEISVRSL